MRRHNSLAVSLFQGAGLVAALKYADNRGPVVQDSEIVARLFPAVAGVDLRSPAFASPGTVPKTFADGTTGPTDQLTLEDFLQTLAARNEWMKYHTPTFRSEEGRSLPYVFLSTSNLATDAVAGPDSRTNTTGKVRIWMQGGVHGNEPGGDQALLALLGKLDANAAWAASILDKVDILMLPRYNPDGVAYFQRYLATSFDPNRDHTKLARQQTRDIKRLVMDFAPHVGVDCHEYGATRGFGSTADHWHPAPDGMFSAMKNLNIHRDIRRLSETLFADSIAAALEARGLRWSAYATDSDGPNGGLLLEEATGDAKMGDTSVGLSQAVMFLTETRGIGLADQHFQRRVASGLTMVEALVQTAADNAALVYSTVENARADFISNNDEIVVTDYARPTNISWTVIDIRNGTLISVPVAFLNTTPAVANLTRARPEAYVFSRAWHDVADRLRAAGVVVDELRADFRGQVEAFNITAAVVASSKYEGVARTTVTTETVRKTITIPAGGYWVNTRQKNAAHAFNVLEPENIDSYATFNVLPVSAGDEYQVYRVMK
ncbi:carboxypeptidase 2 [Magnaporthiopsis poae ATCC 64411]|uniref:Carboxypeptidase M14B n=1 Tax=Magnaporthiopsis poae (strain ATCC 64411 / 73-15) TaxID=644358 RepID=A0A0C4DZ42_MAGP6|nr:carboxypeptidase 2 [Magnaporthiopsis poae ATCC 64411]